MRRLATIDSMLAGLPVKLEKEKKTMEKRLRLI